MAQTKSFLLEIGTEEMPSAPLINAVKQLGKMVAAGLDDAGLAHGDVRVLSTPRRLAAIVSDVATQTDEVHEVKRGPAASIAFDADGNPTKAAIGFGRKFGVDASDLVRREDSDGREYVFAEKNVESRPAIPILTKVSQDVIAGLQWPNYRSQRWGSEHATFVRPVRWICALLGSEVVPVSYADITSSNVTRGHRVLGPGEHVVACPEDYESVLEAAGARTAEERVRVIREQIAQVEAERDGAHVDTPKKTFDEVVNLCEWPTVLVGKFDEEFLDVPHEIICESMLSNQRYFPIYDRDGNLTREFVVVSNGNPDCSATIIDGNERVVRARLDDAKFFYEEDLKVSLDEFASRLDRVVFQEKLGTVLQKVERMEVISRRSAELCGLSAEDVEKTVRAAHLAKADLVSQAVVEFTSQQGVMGGYYARAAGEPVEVCEAIAEHYRPRFAGDELPSGTVGKLVALSDKLDTVCGIFAIDEPPTGSSDPFAVRRSAIGVIALLRSLPQFALRDLIACALDSLAAQGVEFDAEKVTDDVATFFSGRLASIARDEGVRPDTIEALASADIIDPTEFLRRAHALEDARADEPELFDDLATAYARASHLGDAALGCAVDADSLGGAESTLLAACDAGEASVQAHLAAGDYEAALADLAGLREPIDTFFDEVLVMDENEAIRNNRLRLLNRFARVFDGVADIGALARKR